MAAEANERGYKDKWTDVRSKMRAEMRISIRAVSKFKFTEHVHLVT